MNQKTKRPRGSVSTLNELELSYNPKLVDPPIGDKVDTPCKAYKVIQSIWNKNTIRIREEFLIMLLDTRKRCLGYSVIGIGCKSSVIVDISQIAAIAILGNAASVILAHNHPSEENSPSPRDLALSQKIATVLHWHGIVLDDHLIITQDDYCSIRVNHTASLIPVKAYG
jgi:DNA repair protein RadC